MAVWLYRHWAAASLFLAVFLLALAPALTLSWQLPLLMIYLQSPIYMLHQVEEHTGDRFRHFVNQRIFGGLEALTPEAVLVINIPGVWGVTLASLYAALSFGLGWGLAGIYLTLVNGLVHIVGAVLWRAYNPGLWTALALFLPVGGFACWTVSSRPDVEVIHHVTALGIAVAIHVAIVVYTKARAKGLLRAARPGA